MDKIKILHFELSKNLGGIDSFLLNMYTKIDRTIFQFDFVTRYENSAKSDEFKKLGCNIYVVSGFRNPLAYYKDIKKIMSSEYDIVHIHKNSAANIIPFIVAHKIANIRVVAHSHNTAPSVRKVSTSILHKLNRNKLVKYSDVHLACSDAAGEWLYGKGIDYKVVKNGIDTSQFLFDPEKRKQIRKSLDLPENAVVYGHVGHFTEQKNHSYIVDLFKEINKSNPESYLLLVGDGSLKGEIEEYVNSSGIAKKVLFLGNRSDVNELMQAMDYFVMPSIYEGLPIAAVEAQASGLRTILADTISKETEVSSTVSWISLGNPESVAKTIMSLSVVEDRLLSNDEVIQAGFDARETARYLEKLYLRCVGRKEIV